MKSSDIYIRAISQEMPQPWINKIHLNMTYLKFLSNFQGVNELTNLVLHSVGEYSELSAEETLVPRMLLLLSMEDARAWPQLRLLSVRVSDSCPTLCPLSVLCRDSWGRLRRVSVGTCVVSCGKLRRLSVLSRLLCLLCTLTVLVSPPPLVVGSGVSKLLVRP